MLLDENRFAMPGIIPIKATMNGIRLFYVCVFSFINTIFLHKQQKYTLTPFPYLNFIL